jgi:hypothetical protein
MRLHHRYLMNRLSLQVFYLWRHVLSTAPSFILWWSNLEILFAPLHRSSPFIGRLRCQAIQTEHGPYIAERTQKAVYVWDVYGLHACICLCVSVGPEAGSCYAARPRYWREEGYRALPCSNELNFACEKNRRYALPVDPPQRFWSAGALVAEPTPSLADGIVGLRPYSRLRPPRFSPLLRRHLIRRLINSGYLYLW